MKAWMFNLFLSCGGAALIWHTLSHDAREYTRKGAGWLFLKFPGVKKFLKANWPKIKEVCDEAEKGIEEAVEEQDAPTPAGQEEMPATTQAPTAPETPKP